jgi:hypothetical protein
VQPALAARLPVGEHQQRLRDVVALRVQVLRQRVDAATEVERVREVDHRLVAQFEREVELALERLALTLEPRVVAWTVDELELVLGPLLRGHLVHSLVARRGRKRLILRWREAREARARRVERLQHHVRDERVDAPPCLLHGVHGVEHRVD